VTPIFRNAVPPSAEMRTTPLSAEESPLTTPSSENLDADHDRNGPLKLGRLIDIIGPGTPPGQATINLQEELMLVKGEEPATFKQAEGDQAWQQAMKEELKFIEENQTWELVDLPAGHRAIGLKWVYKLKNDAQGVIVKHKARLVTKGYVQKEGVDYEEVFAPVPHLDLVRMLLALAAQENWKVYHMDDKSAFLNGDLNEEVYVLQPPSFVIEGQEHKVFRLNKALYGLCRYPGDQVPPRTSSRSRQKARHAKSHAPACDLPRREPHGLGQLRGHHVSCGLSSLCPTQASSGVATCPTASAPAARSGAAPGPPRVLRPQLPLPGQGQLQGRHVSYGLSSRCPAWGSSGAATCPAA
jgi:hypothetical protein